MNKQLKGRVVADYGQNYKVALPEEITAEASGRMQYELENAELPKIGDWVMVQLLDDGHGLIHEVLPRKSEISRLRPGGLMEKQVLAANVDIAFVVQALDDDFSPRRLRRFMFQLQKDGIEPIVILNKADKVDDLDSKLSELTSFDIEVIVTSAIENEGVDKIAARIGSNQTAVFLGSSGVGKSTITNLLFGEERQATNDIREEDSKGRHTTTHRELFALPNGGFIIDTPGIRELQLWGTEEDLSTAFPEIEALANQCKFRNCSHTVEQGCAILAAIESKQIDQSKLADYFNFQKELRYLNAKVHVAEAAERKKQNKKIAKDYNQIVRHIKKRKR